MIYFAYDLRDRGSLLVQNHKQAASYMLPALATTADESMYALQPAIGGDHQYTAGLLHVSP